MTSKGGITASEATITEADIPPEVVKEYLIP